MGSKSRISLLMPVKPVMSTVLFLLLKPKDTTLLHSFPTFPAFIYFPILAR